jgi:aldose sugar dehydrogenase
VGEQLARFRLDGQKAELVEVLAKRQGRIRDVRQSPDCYIYLAIDNRQGQPTPIVRLEPVARR